MHFLVFFIRNVALNCSAAIATCFFCIFTNLASTIKWLSGVKNLNRLIYGHLWIDRLNCTEMDGKQNVTECNDNDGLKMYVGIAWVVFVGLHFP